MFICGSAFGGYSGTSAAFEMLMQNRKKITELTLMRIEALPWIYQLHDHLPTRAYWPNPTSLQILSDGDSMNESNISLIQLWVQVHLGLIEKKDGCPVVVDGLCQRASTLEDLLKVVRILTTIVPPTRPVG
ncbi:hypothetical protein BGZ83_000707 [Gryganskiella cystojenkinii]|nr:hypothetical protein BGZ83_000707 [Gryganskiella cystojenkinii]